MIRRLGRWLLSRRAGTYARGYSCPRCGGDVDVPGLVPLGAALRVGYAAPTVAEVVKACGCEVAGRPAVAEWPERARRRYAAW